MTRHLNVFVPDDLLAVLDAFAAEHGIKRSAATRLALWRALNAPEPYAAPSLPNWQAEAWALLLRGLFGDERLVLTGKVKALLAKAVGRLSEREAQVLRLRFGLSGPRHTLEEVGAMFGIKRERVRQVEALAMRQLRYWLRTSGTWGLLGPQLELNENI